MIRAIAVSVLLPLLPAASLAQQPPSPPEASTEDGGTWSEGYGRATNYRTALANALEDAVAKVKGVGVARGAGVRSRLSVVSDHTDGEHPGWFDGESDEEKEWVQQQIEGFVLRYEVTDKSKAEDKQWEIRVKALVASRAGLDATIVVDLQDSDLRKWQLERYDETQPGVLVSRERGEFAGPKIAEYLRKSRVVKVIAKGAGVSVDSGSAAAQREKAGQRLVASHRVVIDWEPIVVQSLIEKPNRARPSSRPRPEYLTDGSVQVSLRVVDLVEGTEVLDERFSVSADPDPTMTADRIADFVNRLVDKAKAIVAEKVFFALRPPVVLRKWQDGDEWFVEARVGKRVAASIPLFAIGNNGSLASPDWQDLGRAQLTEGTDDTCTFRLDGVADPSLVEPNVTEVRPIRN
jgi:hypothetical protein